MYAEIPYKLQPISKKVVRSVGKAFSHVIQILYILQNLQIWKRIFSTYLNVLQPLKLGKLALGDFVFDKTRMEFKREIVHIMIVFNTFTC